MSIKLSVGMAKKVHGNTKHGMSHTTEHNIWLSIIQRCSNSNTKSYHRYGGRGIKVCERWRNSFESFLSDMGKRPSTKHSIDRIDNDGNYEPLNCRWATQTEQARNSTAARLVTWNGRTACLAEWSEITGIPYLVILKRLNRGWDAERALTTPIGRQSKYVDRPGSRKITFGDETLLISEWAMRLGITIQSLATRIKKWGLEKALTVSKRRHG